MGRFFRVLVLLSLAIFSLPLFVLKAKSSPTPPPKEKAKVLLQEVQLADDKLRLLVPTKVEAKLSTLVAAEAEGFVTTIKKPLGSQVKAGEAILLIENKDPAFTYAKVPVRAPIAGVISQMNIALMTKVNRGDKLFVVMDPKAIKLSAEIPGADTNVLQPGVKGLFKQTLDEQEGAEIQVTGISPLVDSRTGTASAELEFTNSENAKLPAIGIVGLAVFEISRGQVLMIPESALGYSEGKPIVKVLDTSGTVVKRSVELGEQKESQLVIKSGLAAGDKLIVRSNRTVKEGEAVDIETSKN